MPEHFFNETDNMCDRCISIYIYKQFFSEERSNDSRNETAPSLSFSFFERCLPQRYVSTPIHARGDPRMELSNPLDLSIETTLFAEERPLDLSIGHTSADSTKPINLVLPRKPEETKSPAIPMDLRTISNSTPNNFNEVRGPSVQKREASEPVISSSPLKRINMSQGMFLLFHKLNLFTEKNSYR